MSLPPSSHLASAPLPLVESVHDLLHQDPFEGLGLSGFRLPAVGSALVARPSGEAPKDKEVLLWTVVQIDGSEKPKRILEDRVEHMYHQRTRVFDHPAYPPSLPIQQKVVDED